MYKLYEMVGLAQSGRSYVQRSRFLILRALPYVVMFLLINTAYIMFFQYYPIEKHNILDTGWVTWLGIIFLIILSKEYIMSRNNSNMYITHLCAYIFHIKALSSLYNVALRTQKIHNNEHNERTDLSITMRMYRLLLSMTYATEGGMRDQLDVQKIMKISDQDLPFLDQHPEFGSDHHTTATVFTIFEQIMLTIERCIVYDIIPKKHVNILRKEAIEMMREHNNMKISKNQQCPSATKQYIRINSIFYLLIAIPLVLIPYGIVWSMIFTTLYVFSVIVPYILIDGFDNIHESEDMNAISCDMNTRVNDLFIHARSNIKNSFCVGHPDFENYVGKRRPAQRRIDISNKKSD
jgi:hypothetical protein